MPSDDILTLPAPPADARLAYGTDPNQFGELRLPKSGGTFSIVMNIHGCFLRAQYFLKHTGHIFAALTANCVATWKIEYRPVENQRRGRAGDVLDSDIAHSL